MSEETAYHEAGHALVAVYVGVRVRSITIEPDWDDGPERYGDTQIEWRRGEFTERAFREKAVLVALAGPVAEMLHRGEPLHPGLVAEWSDDWRQAWEAAAPLVPDTKKRLAYLEQATREICRLLDDEAAWATLAVIVDHLLAHETLEGEMVEEILADWVHRG